MSASDHSLPTSGPLTPETLGEWCRRHQAPFIPLSRLSSDTFYVRPLPGVDKYTGIMSRRTEMFAGLILDGALMPLEGIVLTRDFRVISDGLVHQQGLASISLAGVPPNLDPTQTDLFSVFACAAHINQECIYVGGSQNFGHFMFQGMLRLAVLNWLPELRSFPIAVYDNLPARYFEFLDLLGYTAERRIVIPSAGPTRFAAVWQISLPMFRAVDGMAVMWPEAVWSLRQSLGHLLRPTPGPRRRIFIPRGRAGWRRLVNETEILACLTRHRVVPVALDTMSAVDQIRTVASAELIVSVLGAASGILALAASDSRMIEMIPPETVGTFGTVGYSAIMGLPFHRLEGRAASAATVAEARLPPNPKGEVYDADFTIDVAELDAALTRAAQP